MGTKKNPYSQAPIPPHPKIIIKNNLNNNNNLI